MLKKLALLSIWLALPLAAQTVNPNQIRPATVDGQVLTTPIANQAPSWQTPASGVSVATTPPCTVNGGTGPVSSGTATITCVNGIQMKYTPGGSGQHVLVFATSASCSGGSDNTCTYSGFALPSYVVQANVTAVYAIAISASTDIGGSELESWGVTGGGATWPGGQFNLVPGGAATGVWAPGQATVPASSLPTNYSGISFASEFCCHGDTVSVGMAALDIYYTGTAPPASNPLLIQSPLNYNPQTNTLSLYSPFDAGYDFGAVNASQVSVPLLVNGPALGDQMTLIPGYTSTSTTPTVAVTNAALSGAHTIVNQDGSALAVGALVANVPILMQFDGTYWRIVGSASGGAAITALTGDVNATGPGSAAATVVKVNNGAIPTSQPCVGTNSSGQFVDGSCGGGGGGGISDPTVINLTASPYYASPYGATTTTGTFSASATSGTVGSCSNFVANNGVLIVGGASGGWTGTDYIGTVVSCTGTTMTITPAITNAVSGHVVQHDETAAIQSAITALTAGGVIVLPNASSTTQGIYLVNGPLQNTGTANAILQMPTINSGLANPNIKIEGFTTWYSSPIIQTSLSTSSAALFGAYGPVSPHLTGVGLWFKNVQIFGPASGSATMIDGTNMQALSFEGNVRVQAATSGIATTGNGVLFPSIANNVALTVSGVLGVQGFGTAVRLGEHSAGLDILVANSTNGMVFDVAPNGTGGDPTPNSISVQHIWCGPPSSAGGPTTVSNCLAAGSTATTIHVADVDYEGSGGTLINDPSNLLHGDVNYALNNAASCPTSPTLSGATNLALMSLNCVAGGTKTVTTGSVTNNHYAAFNADGSIKDGGAVGAPSATFSIATGAAASPAAPYVLAPASGTVSDCYWTTLTSDGSTNLVFNVKFNGTNILSGTNATVTAGDTTGSSHTFSLTSGTITITQGQKWELDITTGTTNWTGAVQCY